MYTYEEIMEALENLNDGKATSWNGVGWDGNFDNQYGYDCVYSAIMESLEELFLENSDPDDETENPIWYAVVTDEDNDWGTGSYDYQKAVEMCERYGKNAYIAVIEEGNDPICVKEIRF